MPGSCPSGFSPSCWGSYLDRSRPRALERLLPHPTRQEGQGPPHPQARRGLFQLRCAAVLVASPPLPLPSDAVEHLTRAAHRVGCFHGEGLISSPKQPFEGTVIVPISPMQKLRLTEVLPQGNGRLVLSPNFLPPCLYVV